MDMSFPLNPNLILNLNPCVFRRDEGGIKIRIKIKMKRIPGSCARVAGIFPAPATHGASIARNGWHFHNNKTKE